jgi:hypothetical protein
LISIKELKNKEINFRFKPFYPVAILLALVIIFSGYLIISGEDIEIKGHWYSIKQKKSGPYTEKIAVSNDTFKVTREGSSIGTMEVLIKEYDNSNKTFKGVVLKSEGAFRLPTNPTLYFKFSIREKDGGMSFGINNQKYPQYTPYGIYAKNNPQKS